MGVAGELSLESQRQSQLKTSLPHTSQFYFLDVWQAGGLTYDICEVVSFLTKSDVGWDTICSKGGGFQIAGPVPTERGTGLTSKKGGYSKMFNPNRSGGF